jgi:hypothetical protein
MTRPRKGTKDTQGVGNDVTAHRRMTAAAMRATSRTLTPCPMPAHRPSDWRLRSGPGRAAGPVVCGVCHPPAPGLNIARRGEPGFEVRR